MRDAARTHNTTHSSRCVWPRANSRRSRKSKPPAPVHAAPTLHPHHRPRSHADYTCRTAAHPQLLRHLHRKYMHKCMQVPHQRSTSAPPTVGMMCQPQQVERTPAHARAKTRTILYAHGTRLNCADEAHARRALCMHEPWYRFLQWYALPRKPPCRPPPPSCLTPTLACALMRPSRRAPLKYCVGGGGRGRWQSR